ncbi:MAG: agmatinase [Planctomycetota bacterium]|jgi:agmatinase|nr:agmatinase [Planctomycetota bacterium]
MTAKIRRRRKARSHYANNEFLGLPREESTYSRAAAVILPLPFEESVSYGGGTALGPEAIIDASKQVELYDAKLGVEAALAFGIHTLSPPEIMLQVTKPSAAKVLDAVAESAFLHCQAGKFVVGLGGEHTVSVGLARGAAKARGAFTLVHLDAHADLRDSYKENPLSHACAIRRIAEIPECEGIVQLGIRSTSVDQFEFARARRPKSGIRPYVKTHYADDMLESGDWEKDLVKRVKGREIYFTFDVDGLDPSIIPATGTPEPNGLAWRHLLKAAEIVASHAFMTVGMDCVELAPQPDLHYADFTAAKAVYAMLSRFVIGNRQLKG